jgi:hypothetical protein
MSPKINTEVQAEPPFFAGLLGEIQTAEAVKTAVSGYEGIRVKVEEISTGDEYVEMLWVRGFVGAKSKLGCFIQALGDNTDAWAGKVIRIVKWEQKDRIIEVVEKPVKKAVKKGETPS